MTGDFSTPNYKLSHYGKVKRDLKKHKKIAAGEIPAVIFSDSERFLQLRLHPSWSKCAEGRSVMRRQRASGHGEK